MRVLSESQEAVLRDLAQLAGGHDNLNRIIQLIQRETGARAVQLGDILRIIEQDAAASRDAHLRASATEDWWSESWPQRAGKDEYDECD